MKKKRLQSSLLFIQTNQKWLQSQMTSRVSAQSQCHGSRDTVLLTFHCAAPPYRRKTLAFLTRRQLTQYPTFLTLYALFTATFKTSICPVSTFISVRFWEQPAITSLNSINLLAFAIHTQTTRINPFRSNFSATSIVPSSYLFWAGKRLVGYL
jgi:hypothetical protein